MNNEEESRRVRRLLKAENHEAQGAFAEQVRFVDERQEFIAWREQGRIVSAAYEGRRLYPAFQFDEAGRPRAEVAQVISVLTRDPSRTDWQNAMWFVAANGWLGGKSPAHCLDDLQAVLDAAEHAVTPNEY